MSRKKNYIEPSEFFDEMMKCLVAGQISDKLSIMFMKLSEKYANHQNFVRYYHIREDLISTAILSCVKSFPKFRPYKDMEWDGKTIRPYHYTTCNNPFAFFTKCIHNDFLQLLRGEYRQRNVVNKMKLSEGLEADYGYVDMIKDKEEEARQENCEDQPEEPTRDEDGNVVTVGAGGIQW